MTHRIFLLSPANCSGRRASYLLRKDGASELARRLRSGEGATIGEVFTFMSGLYFRGKLAYAAAFTNPPPSCLGVQVIVPGSGLRPAEERIEIDALREIARVPVDLEEQRYARPLRRDASALAGQLGEGTEVVLLGSVATRKYIEPLSEGLGDWLRFPEEFIGRGDMSRGGLMLKCVRAGRELTYIRIGEQELRGRRAVKIAELP
ncbi:MAG: hypothetical protein HY700_09525 [Gemmatimonadetes bacterium]|nr:hypothetical protein [Gemmatimonadota bacterium]